MLRVISTYDFDELIKNINSKECQEVETLNSHGRILANDIVSSVNIPGFRRSSVDGYAVRSRDTYLCSETMPAILKLQESIEIGTKPSIDIDDMQCSYIPTGGMLPVGADSVVMIEDAEDLDDEVLINKSVSVNENVVSSNEDISCGDVVIKAGEIINSTLIAILISLDIRHVKVRRFIKAGVISTGDELLGIDEPIQVPKIKDTNGPYLTAALREDGCISTHYGILKDNEDNILSTVKKALSENDIVFMSGGSSAGNKDFTEKVMKSLGELMFHGLAIKPGKPTLMARCNGDKFIIGLPGHPLACTIVYRFIISKLINKLMGKNTTIIEHTVEISENYHKARGREEYLPVIIRGEIAYPLHAKSSAMSVMARCNGVIRIDRDVEGIQKGEKVKVMR